MNGDLVLYIGRRMLEVSLLVAAPVLLATLLLGLLVAMMQAVTSIRDMTLGLVLKIACVGVVLLITGSWMLQTTMDFTAEIFNHMQTLGH